MTARIYRIIRHPTKNGWTFDDGKWHPLCYYHWGRAAHPTAIAVMLMLRNRMDIPWRQIVWPTQQPR